MKSLADYIAMIEPPLGQSPEYFTACAEAARYAEEHISIEDFDHPEKHKYAVLKAAYAKRLELFPQQGP